MHTFGVVLAIVRDPNFVHVEVGIAPFPGSWEEGVGQYLSLAVEGEHVAVVAPATESGEELFSLVRFGFWERRSGEREKI